MCLTRVLGQTLFLMGGLWHFSTLAVFIEVLTDLIMCVWVGLSYHSNLHTGSSDLTALCLVRKPLEWDNVIFWHTL